MILDFGDDNQHLKPKEFKQYDPKDIMKASEEYFGGDELTQPTCGQTSMPCATATKSTS